MRNKELIFSKKKMLRGVSAVPDAKSVLKSSRILWFSFTLQKLGAGFSYVLFIDLRLIDFFLTEKAGFFFTIELFVSYPVVKVVLSHYSIYKKNQSQI